MDFDKLDKMSDFETIEMYDDLLSDACVKFTVYCAGEISQKIFYFYTSYSCPQDNPSASNAGIYVYGETLFDGCTYTGEMNNSVKKNITCGSPCHSLGLFGMSYSRFPCDNGKTLDVILIDSIPQYCP